MNKLRNEFGCTKAQWGFLKHMYGVGLLKELQDDMDEGHSNYLASFIFGRYRDEQFYTAVKSGNMSQDLFRSHYMRLYSRFDGKHKRALMKLNLQKERIEP